MQYLYTSPTLAISPRFDESIASADAAAPFKLGILGGTFDPVHVGHMALAEAAYISQKLDGVLFVPTGQPVEKRTSCYAPAEDRYAMLAVALAGIPHFDVSRIEIDRAGVTYTIDTLRALDKAYGARAQLYFIAGADVVDNLPTWKDAEEIAGLVTVLATRRGGYASTSSAVNAIQRSSTSAAASTKDISFTIISFDMPLHTISSTEIRRHAKEGLPLTRLMPLAAEEYLKEHQLYD